MISSSLLDEYNSSGKCYYIESTHIKHLHRNAPYYFWTPSPLTYTHLNAFSKSAENLLKNITSKPINLIGVSTHGVPYASSLLYSKENSERSLSIVCPHTKTFRRDGKSDPKEYNVVIDNSINSGDTLKIVKSILNNEGKKIDLVMVVFDHMTTDDSGIDLETRYESISDCPVMAAFSIFDLLSIIENSLKPEIIRYIEKYGSNKAKKILSDLTH